VQWSQATARWVLLDLTNSLCVRGKRLGGCLDILDILGVEEEVDVQERLRREAAARAGSTEPVAPVPVPAQAEKASESDKIARTRGES